MNRRFFRFVGATFLQVAILIATVPSFAATFPEDYPLGHILRAGEPVPNEYLVLLRPQLPPHAAELIAAAAGGTVGVKWSNIFDGFLFKGSESAAQALLRNPNVLIVEENGIGHTSAYQNPAPWNLDITDGSKEGTLEGDGGYTYCNTGAGVRAYIVDTGVRGTHQQFWTSSTNQTSRVTAGWQPPHWNPTQTNNPGNGYPNNPCNTWSLADMDQYLWGHGTAVASVLGGLYSGVAKAVEIVPVRVVDCRASFEVSDLVSGLDWIFDQEVARKAGGQSNPSVANLSIYKTSLNADHGLVDIAVQNLISGSHAIDPGKGTFSPGVSIVTSANNKRMNVAPSSPTSCNPSFTPARVPEAITVAGMMMGGSAGSEYETMWTAASATCFDSLSNPGSNYGPRVDIFAPARNISAAHVWNGGYSDTAFRPLSFSFGTSFASPIVAGFAAQALESSPWREPSSVWGILEYWAVATVTGQPTSPPVDVTTSLRVQKRCRFRTTG